MAVVEDNSLEFVLQETAKGFSLSGKSVYLKPEPVAASSTEKMFWRFYQLVSAKVFVSKSIYRKIRPVF